MDTGVPASLDQVSVGVLVDAVPREAVDEAVAVCGVRERRSDGKLPVHVFTYLMLVLSLIAEEDYEVVAAQIHGVAGPVPLMGRLMERADRQRYHLGPEMAG